MFPGAVIDVKVLWFRQWCWSLSGISPSENVQLQQQYFSCFKAVKTTVDGADDSVPLAHGRKNGLVVDFSLLSKEVVRGFSLWQHCFKYELVSGVSLWDSSQNCLKLWVSVPPHMGDVSLYALLHVFGQVSLLRKKQVGGKSGIGSISD